MSLIFFFLLRTHYHWPVWYNFLQTCLSQRLIFFPELQLEIALSDLQWAQCQKGLTKIADIQKNVCSGILLEYVLLYHYIVFYFLTSPTDVNIL